MIVKIMGLADIAAAVWIFLLYSGTVSWQSTLWVVFYLLAKGFIFRGGVNSFLDKAIALFTLLMFFGLHWVWGTAGAGIWLAQRGVISLL